MARYQVKLKTVITTTVWVEAETKQEAQSIAYHAWRYGTLNPTIQQEFDPSIYAVREHDEAKIRTDVQATRANR